MKKAWNILSTLLVWIVVIAACLVMLFTILSGRAADPVERDLFGYRFYIVLSNSMSATGIHAGDMVIVKSVDPTTLDSGDIISYRSQNPEAFGSVVTHMIRSRVIDRHGDPGFVTYGTATNVDDGTVVTYPYVCGKYQTHLPKIGKFFQFLKTPAGYVCCILLPFLLLIGSQTISCIKAFWEYKSQKQQETTPPQG